MHTIVSSDAQLVCVKDVDEAKLISRKSIQDTVIRNMGTMSKKFDWYYHKEKWQSTLTHTPEIIYFRVTVSFYEMRLLEKSLFLLHLLWVL